MDVGDRISRGVEAYREMLRTNDPPRGWAALLSAAEYVAKAVLGRVGELITGAVVASSRPCGPGCGSGSIATSGSWSRVFVHEAIRQARPRQKLVVRPRRADDYKQRELGMRTGGTADGKPVRSGTAEVDRGEI
jgi:hypothetical protein